MSLKSLMNTSVDVQRPTKTRGTEGGQSASWPTTYAGLRCRIQPLSAREAVLYGRETEQVTHRMYIDASVIIGIQDRVIYSSRTFFVVGVRDTDEQGRLKVVELREEN